MATPMITGIVVDPQGHPVAGAVVAVTAAPVPVPDIAAVTGQDGRFSIMVSATGSYRLLINAGPATTEHGVDVGPDRAEVTVEIGS